MEIIFGRAYRITVTFPWGEVREMVSSEVTRGEDGAVTWPRSENFAFEPVIDCMYRETGELLEGFVGGTCDTTGVVAPHADRKTT